MSPDVAAAMSCCKDPRSKSTRKYRINESVKGMWPVFVGGEGLEYTHDLSSLVQSLEHLQDELRSFFGKEVERCCWKMFVKH